MIFVNARIRLILQIKYDQAQIEPEKDVTATKCDSIATTYEDIMSFLENLENGIKI